MLSSLRSEERVKVGLVGHRWQPPWRGAIGGLGPLTASFGSARRRGGGQVAVRQRGSENEGSGNTQMFSWVASEKNACRHNQLIESQKRKPSVDTCDDNGCNKIINTFRYNWNKLWFVLSLIVSWDCSWLPDRSIWSVITCPAAWRHASLYARSWIQL